MKKKMLAVLMAATMVAAVTAGCGEKAVQEAEPQATEAVSEEVKEENVESVTAEKAEEPAEDTAVLEDGTYTATFTTDSSMFHINEAYGDKGILKVQNGEMTIHITLPSKNIVNLFPGSAEDAQKDGAVLLEPTTDIVKYEDGTTEEATTGMAGCHARIYDDTRRGKPRRSHGV